MSVMKGGKSRDILLREVGTILEFQFGHTDFSEIIKKTNLIKIDFSRKTGKIKNIHYKGERILTYKPQTGSYNLSIQGAKILHASTKKPLHRVQVMDAIEPYVREGKSVFSKHILSMGKELRYGSEVLVVNESDELLAIGKLTIPSYQCSGFDVGQAVAIRKSIKSESTT